MKHLWRALALVVAMVTSPPLAAANGNAPTASPERQILVMVKHPADHYRATGAFGGGYGD